MLLKIDTSFGFEKPVPLHARQSKKRSPVMVSINFFPVPSQIAHIFSTKTYGWKKKKQKKELTTQEFGIKENNFIWTRRSGSRKKRSGQADQFRKKKEKKNKESKSPGIAVFFF